MIKIITFILAFPLLLGACGHEAIYQNYASITDEQWHANDTIQFTVDSLSTQAVSIVTTLRHTTLYPMTNMWCAVEVTNANGTKKLDTLNIHIAEINGKWVGRGGALKTVISPVSLHFPAITDSTTIRLWHLMRTDPLVGIHDIGIQINIEKETKYNGKE